MPLKHGSSLTAHRMLIIHRLHYGGAMQYVPPSLLEGGPCETTPPPFVPNSLDLSREVEALHTLARVGAISADAAERQINTYLLAPSAWSQGHPPRVPVSWLRMPLADAPHHSTMPDLGTVLHSVLARETSSNSLKLVVELCIPRFRHLSRPIPFTDSQPPLLALVLGLLLGLYNGCVKKPRFAVRAALFAHLRKIMASPPEKQTEFCVQNDVLIVFACMEYMARVPPVLMPTQFQTICEGDPHVVAFYRRIPPLADELRQWIDKGDDAPSWPEMVAECRGKMERVTRLKRGGQALAHPPAKQQQAGSSALTVSPADASACWEAPRLGPSPTPSEYTLLGMDLGIPGDVIRRIQQQVRVSPLPANLKAMQFEGVRRKGIARCRASYLRTHWPICSRCVLTHKQGATPPTYMQMRLDTVSRTLVCAACLSSEIVYVNLLGRTMLYHNTTFFVCPSCVTIQAYTNARQQPWSLNHASECQCQQQGASSKQGHGKQPRRPCCICGENSQANPISRVDHLTGQMQLFHYCQRHTPRPEAVRRCVNAREMAGVELRSTPRAKR
jgi:hypothetical protein